MASGFHQRRVTKPFCKVCFDSNKSEQEYTSHYVKDAPGPAGKVVCPTLLVTICRYCRCLGHFKSHCPKLTEKKQAQRHARKPRVVTTADGWTKSATSGNHKKPIRQTAAPVVHFNIFDAISPDNDSNIAAAKPKKSTTKPVLAVGKPKQLQGAWRDRICITSSVTPVEDVPPIIDIRAVAGTGATPEVSSDDAILSRKRFARIQQVEEELAEAREDLASYKEAMMASRNARGKISWADKGDVEDAEMRVQCIEEKLERLNNKI